MVEKAKELTYTVPTLSGFEDLYEILDKRVGPSQRSRKEDLVRIASWAPTAYVTLTNYFTPENVVMANQYISEIIGGDSNLTAESLIMLVVVASGVMVTKGMGVLGNMTGLGTERNKRLRESYSGMLSDMQVVDKGLEKLSLDEKNEQKGELTSIYRKIIEDYQDFLDGKTNNVPVAIREKSILEMDFLDRLKENGKYSRTTPWSKPNPIGDYLVYYAPLKRPRDLK